MSSSFATKIRRWRDRHKLFQKQAAEILGVNLRTYEAWECGRYIPPISPMTRDELEKRMKEYGRGGVGI